MTDEQEATMRIFPAPSAPTQTASTAPLAGPAGPSAWARTEAEIAGALRLVRPGRFLLVRFVEIEGIPEWDPWPYAQCRPDGAGWFCETVSTEHLPAAHWPIDELALRRTGWHAPRSAGENWQRWVESREQAAVALVEALRVGRDCQDPAAYRWQVRALPAGPDGGQPLPLRALAHAA